MAAELTWHEKLLADLDRTICDSPKNDIWEAVAAVTDAISNQKQLDRGNNPFLILYGIHRLLMFAFEDQLDEGELEK